MGVDGRHDLTIHFADQHHRGDLEGFGVSDPQAVEELWDLSEALHDVADLWTTAVYDDRPDSERLQEHDVVGEGLHQLRVDHCIATELDDDRRATELADVWQGFDENFNREGRITRHEVPMFSSTYAWVRSFVNTEPRPEPSPRSQQISRCRCSMCAATAARSWSTSTPPWQTVTSP